MAFRYEGKIPTMEYKTLRYPGHAEMMETIRELGLLDLEPVDVKGTKVVPRDVFVSVVGPEAHEADRARICSRCASTVTGTKDGKPATRRFELIDQYDEEHGISAMMRTTGYSLSITGQMQARGEVDAAGRLDAGRVHARPRVHRRAAEARDGREGKQRLTVNRTYRDRVRSMRYRDVPIGKSAQ